MALQAKYNDTAGQIWPAGQSSSENHAVPNVHYVLLLIVRVMLLATCSYLAEGCCQPPVRGVSQASQRFTVAEKDSVS